MFNHFGLLMETLNVGDKSLTPEWLIYWEIVFAPHYLVEV